MEVSWHFPSITALRLDPFPRWQMMIFFPMGLIPRNSHTLRLTYRWLVPWKPYRRTCSFSSYIFGTPYM